MAEDTSGEMLETLLDTLFIGEERLSVAELRRRAVAEDMPSDVLLSIDTLPEGEYAQDEVLDALHTHAVMTPPAS
ncbi:hypothetical protein [Catellatospora sichuanensis]|uniref:hypothetical protein n=1 Tax=Catellatospora sichuanensis TaxID=1969805 RepID=UPI0011832BC2|nr:hypothetical protein [Catellatospora sichuanensis]